MTLSAGDRLGRYEILGALGAGGMGEVYRARDTELERDVAIKVLPEAVARDPDRLDRFEREAKAVAKLSHPNILEIHDYGHEGEISFSVTELLEGETLRERVPSGGVGWQRAAEIGAAVAEGLAAAHTRGVIHRDLKPENIFITSDGRVKILDFGLARVQQQVSSEAETGTLTPAGTEAGTVMGTVGYMAPEQVKGQPADARSDIFALGCVLYEMITGRRAFARETNAETIAAILKEDPPVLSDSGVAVPVELERGIRRCLEKSPEARYQSASDLAYNLKTISTDAAVRVTTPTAVKRRRERPSRTGVLAAVGILMVALVAILAVLSALDVAGIRRLLPGRGGGDPQVIRMAVLPFVNMTGDPEQEYLADGMTQEMISQLGRLHPKGLSVIARSSVMRYKGGDTPIDQIGRELGVDYVLEGSARREANRVRITTELIQVRDQTQLWADTYERELEGILAIQSEVAQEVAAALALELLPSEEARLASTRAVDPEAYEAYLKGTYQSARLNSEGLDTAERYFELALEKDPSYAPAYAGLAGVWATRQQMGFTPPHEAGPKAKAAALRAIELDDRSAEAHRALAWVLTWTDWDWEGAGPEWRRALELNPSDADTHASYAHFLANTGRAEEAILHSERSLKLDPVNAFFKGMFAAVLTYNHRHEEALGVARTALAMQPDNPLLLNIIWLAESHAGNFEEAVTTVKRFLGVIYADPAIEEALDGGWVEGGYTEAMSRAAAALETRNRTSFVLPTDIAVVWVEAGEHDKALKWLERGFEVHDPAMPYLGLPLFDPLRSDPRFQKLLRRMNLPME